MFFEHTGPYALPTDYTPRRPEHFYVRRIVLAKGARTTQERRNYIAKIIALYPEAEIIEKPDTPHNRIAPNHKNLASRLRLGKQTLVFGEHKSAVRFSNEASNICPNYWHFSPYGFCFYGCTYCYLSGTRTFVFSPAVKVFVNLDEILEAIDRQAYKQGRVCAFYLGKLQDGLALDPLCGTSRVLAPFFAAHPFARMTLLTKSADVDNLLDLDHQGHTILSWSVNPPEIHDRFERNVPHPEQRLQAMQRCAKAGYPVRAVLMPIIPVEGWEEIYGRFLRELLLSVPLQRLTIGGICTYPDAKRLMEESIGEDNLISQSIHSTTMCQADHRARFSKELRIKLYGALLDAAREVRPDLDVALCLEEEEVLNKVGLSASQGRCNCPF
ncbi:Radical SAM domain protein [Desulfatibacillum aliphaticivorans]|uniref:Radical SAM domain protein n=1 Tax=Desulfatibacillum aliphaticivorans TaxID=218208 RepID=B8FLD7_DESAL|nr:radical SAM protein [Desulfatibacillum aliphaticivorans]ACL05083.1 Radical SAM domain protein [Desulfatibacillum aliphaticivorans]